MTAEMCGQIRSCLLIYVLLYVECEAGSIRQGYGGHARVWGQLTCC